jgi:multidrug efflux pump subunit AcrB
MTSLPRFSVNNPVLVNILMTTIVLGGVYSMLTIVREMFPESRPERVQVITLYPGATPAEVEKGITRKIEEEIKDLKGVEKVTSSTTEGRSHVIIELASDFENIDQAVLDVKSAVDSIPSEDFPQEALEPRVTKFEPRFPVISVAVYGNLTDRALKSIGETLRDDLLDLPNVTDVTLSGTRRDEISVEVRPEKLAEFELSFIEVADAIATTNLDLPGGQVRTPGVNVSVRTLGEKDRGEELYDLVVRSAPQGDTLRLRDLATIVDGFEDVDATGRFNGAPAANVTVYKTADQDAIEIAGMVRALVAGKMGRPLERPWTSRLAARLTGRDTLLSIYERAQADPYPAGFRVETHTDLSRIVESRLELLTRNGKWGLALVFLSLLVFLHWRVALWVMMGLVLAIAGSLMCLQLLGQTLNLMTMGGFIIVLGILVDDGIIVSENVYSKIEQGLEPKLAAITGTEEVTWPVFCAVTTTIVAFVPLRFIEGQIGDWMGVLPVVVCVALSVSLVEALTILPSHLAHNLKIRTVDPPAHDGRTGPANHRWAEAMASLQQWFVGTLRNRYERLLRIAVAYRYATMAALGAVMLITLGGVAGGHVPVVFLQKMDSETLITRLNMPVGTPAEVTQRAVEAVEQAALKLPEMRSIYTLVGIQVSEDGVAQPPHSHLAQCFIELEPIERRERSSDDVTRELRQKTHDIPGVEKLRFSAIHGGPAGDPIHLEIQGDDVSQLIAVAGEIKDRLSRFDGVFDIVDDFDAGKPEAQIEIFNSAKAVGLTTESLATQVRAAFYGYEARKVQRGREDVKIMVRYPLEHRRRIYDIESMRVATASGTLVPFTEVARLTESTGFASIKRTNQRRTVTVTADVDESVTNADGVMNRLSVDVFPELAERYPGVRLEYGGQRLEMAKSFGSLKQNFVIALVLIFVILAGLFRSYVQPLIVMTAIPFGLVGAVAGHYVMGYPLTIASMTGLVALTGVVVNDSLVMVTFINDRVRNGLGPLEAVIEGGRARLRPILLTSATTVLGMGPLLLEQSFQAKFLIPMAISISAGLLFATVLTLAAVPALYLIVLDFRRAGRKFVYWLLNKPMPDIVLVAR